MSAVEIALLVIVAVWLPPVIFAIRWHNRDFDRRVGGRPYTFGYWAVLSDDPVVQREAPGYIRRSAILAAASLAILAVLALIAVDVFEP